ncbi:hypothetical protein MGN70_011202 [Eutypa lata]|nr:hypothetical protein MGN70_011202 [Eutypa lata]
MDLLATRGANSTDTRLKLLGGSKRIDICGPFRTDKSGPLEDLTAGDLPMRPRSRG